MNRGGGFGPTSALEGGQGLPTRFGGFGSQRGSSTLSYLAEPPSLSAISDPNLVVPLKNLLKKDSTTKAKALEEILGHVQQAGASVEDALLDLWVQMYPRASIDNSRRVRELSHNLQFELLKAGRKRMERRLTSIVATWIAGLFDRDRGVARAANAGLSSFLTSPEKMNSFWLKCQAQILDYAVASMRETPDTLSDERSTTKEDSEAKYYRVLYASLCLVNGLLQRASQEDLSSFQSRYEDYFRDNTVWELIEASDPSIRRAVCHLLFACLDRGMPYADTKPARQVFVTGGLRTAQAGTALEYVRALSKLTEAHPEVWTTTSGKKSPMVRLRAFLAKGSQGSPPRFWESVDQLVQVLPVDQSFECASELITSIESGITHREEPRTNTSMAWKCYIDTAKRFLGDLAPNDQLSFASQHIAPLFERFLFSPPGKAVAIPLGPNAMGIFVEAHRMLARTSPELRSALCDEWAKLSRTFCRNISGSLPEVSKDFESSQNRLSEEGRRWFGLVGEIQRVGDTDANVTSPIVEPSAAVIVRCMEILQNRNLKPFGAARVLEFALSTSQYLFEGDLGQQCVGFLSSAPLDNMQLVVESPSSTIICSFLVLLRTVPQHRSTALEVWQIWLDRVLAMGRGTARDAALISLTSSDDVSQQLRENTPYQEEVLSRCSDVAQNSQATMSLLGAVLDNDTLSQQTLSSLGGKLLQALDSDPSGHETATIMLERLVKAHPDIFVKDETMHTGLVRQLLSMESSQSPAVSNRVAGIRSVLAGDSSGTLPRVVSIIQQNLESAGPQCLSVETLVRQAHEALDNGVSSEEIFPSTNSYKQALLPFLQRPIDPSMSIMNTTGDVSLLASPENSSAIPPQPRDSNGRSVPVRMSLYICELLSEDQKLRALPGKFQVELLYLQALVVQLVSDQISLNSANGPWKSLQPSDAMTQAEWLVATSRTQLLDLAGSDIDWADKSSSVMPQLLDLLTEESKGLTPAALYSSRALSEIFEAVVERTGIPGAWAEKFLDSTTLKADAQTVNIAAAVLSGFGDMLQSTKAVNVLCNRLVSDLAAAKVSTDKAAMVLSLLSLCGSIYHSNGLPVPSNRVVFAVKQVTDWFETGTDMSPEFASACLRCLTHLLPCMKELYGSFWEKTLHFCVRSCETADQHSLSRMLPLIHASLKLTRTLQELDDANDDLDEALSAFSKKRGDALVALLRLDRDMSTQPLDVTDRLISRELAKLTTKQLPDPEELYGLVASGSETVQTAAFSMLHRLIPEQQQQKSVDVILNKTNARLPDELLSLLLDAPTLDQYSDEMLATFPPSIRGYLLSWELIFDTLSASPLKVRQDIAEVLKNDKVFDPLLDFMFDVLGHSAGYPLKLEKEGLSAEHIKDYDVQLANAELEEKSMHWMLIHLFYLSLRYLPGLFTTWFQDCRSKQTKLAVESWTQSYFSPLIIEDALNDVQTWVDSEDFNASGEADIVVKVSKSGKEVSAWYEIDEVEGALAIKLPDNFPIEGVAVRGIRRVAVNERKWQSWIMTTQGVIKFSNGNIIDGLQAFRRNLTGALRGHSECAICYSVIASDQRIPDKSCATCKNLFHRLCLYKWFQTSNNNTCPLCRTPIDYNGRDTMHRRTAGAA